LFTPSGKNEDIFNDTAYDYIVPSNDDKFNYTVYDLYGNEVGNGSSGKERRLNVPRGGMIRITL
ncbi:MAG: hypothetical protein J6330_10595, partial [Clostridia bacterium]|nr:hypothetical protein [Clostridia bacterium]